MSNLIIIALNGIFHLILVFLHFSYSGYQYFGWALNFCKRISTDCMQSQVLDTRFIVSQIVKKLQKCPSHFAVIVGKDGINVEDFSNLVLWCSAARISFVSFYDYSGNLKAKRKIYHDYLLNEKKLDPKCLVLDKENQNLKNGVAQQIHLNIVSLEDGKPALVQVAKNLSAKVVSNELKETEINEKLVGKELFELLGMPEPDLGIICGSIFGTFGFLPWHIRITEFAQVYPGKGIQVSEFISILKRYSSCTQRFGK